MSAVFVGLDITLGFLLKSMGKVWIKIGCHVMNAFINEVFVYSN